MGQINNNAGSPYRLIAASQVHNNVFGTIEMTTNEDAHTFTLTGTTPAFGHRFIDLCASGNANKIVSVNTADYFLVACDAFGIAIISFANETVER